MEETELTSPISKATAKVKVKYVYLAAPLTQGDSFYNVRAAIKAASTLRALGFTPFVPHLYCLWHMLFPQPYDFWIDLDLDWLKKCDAFVWIGGESEGVKIERTYAASLGVPSYEYDAFVRMHQGK